MRIRCDGFGPDELVEFRAAQRRSFAILREVSGRLEEGWSERAATKLLFDAYADHGVRKFFHVPVALFGARTTLPEPWQLTSFGPTRARLDAGAPAIFDASPVMGGYLVDTAISFCAGADPAHAALMAADARFRDSVLTAVQRGDSFRSIAAAVDADITAHGCTNCHRRHPEAVLGHRVLRIEDDTDPAPVDGFHPQALAWFRSEILAGLTEPERTPVWNEAPSSEHRPTHGLWAVEPHIARDGIGVKWEELLVIDHDGPRWLDEPS